MKSKLRGFTLVELIVVITVIGILLAIGIMLFNGYLVSSRNNARATDTRAWASSFDLYKGRFVIYPAMPTADTPLGDATLCLGSFTTTSSKCGKYSSIVPTQYLSASGSSTMLTEIAKVGKVPSNVGASTSFPLAGPLVYLWQTTSGGTVTVNAQFINFFESTCPSDFSDITSSLPTAIALVMSGTSGYKACSITKQPAFTYTPS